MKFYNDDLYLIFNWSDNYLYKKKGQVSELLYNPFVGV